MFNLKLLNIICSQLLFRSEMCNLCGDQAEMPDNFWGTTKNKSLDGYVI